MQDARGCGRICEKGEMGVPFTIIRQDITKLGVDAIVNAANIELKEGGGVCGAIFKAAGAEDMRAACSKLAPIKVGEAVITPGFRLRARYVIHAAGPVYCASDPERSERELRDTYRAALRLAVEYGCESVAFPLISSGTYRFPKDAALSIATSEIRLFLRAQEIDVYLAVFDRVSFVVSEALLGAVESYIDENYVAAQHMRRRELLDVEYDALSSVLMAPRTAERALDDVIGRLDEPFNAALMRLIDAKGLTDVEVYKRANLDRKLFSKIRKGKGYTPGKRTILALAIALRLSLKETDELLECAGYALSHSQKFDVIVEYFIINGKYDIFEINEVLFEYDLPLLGGQ